MCTLGDDENTELIEDQAKVFMCKCKQRVQKNCAECTGSDVSRCLKTVCGD